MPVEESDMCREVSILALGWEAGDAIERGDVVEVHADGLAWKGDGTHPFVGIAMYAASAGDQFSAYCSGNKKVWCKKGTNGINVGEYAKDDTDGGICKGSITNRIGCCLEVNGDEVKILLY